MGSTPALIKSNLTLTGDLAPIIGNSDLISAAFTGNTVYHVENATVTDNYGVATLWAANGGLATFTFGVIVSTTDLLIEFKNDKVTPEYVLMNVPAGVPVYFAGLSRGGTSALISSGQITGIGNIVQIKAQRNVASSVGAAVVSLLLFK